MEKLLEAVASFKRSVSPMKRFFYEPPTIVFEMAQPAGSEEILFFIAMPKRFRDGIEKQVHSFFPGAVIEKMEDYTIFSPGSMTALSMLGLKTDPALPLLTYNAFGTDSLDEFASAMSKLDTDGEGMAIQVVLAPADNGWRKHAKDIARRMQQGKRLKEALEHPGSSHAAFVSGVAKGVVKETATLGMAGKKADPMKPSEEEKTVALTPEEQETLKAIETKSNDPAFRANIRLLASAKTQARADERPGVAVHRARQPFAVLRQQGEQGGQVGRLPLAVQPGLGEADVAAREHGIEHCPVADLHDGVARAGAGENPAAAIRQGQLERAAFETFEQPQQRAGRCRQTGACGQGQGQGVVEGVHRVVSSSGGWGLLMKGTRFSHSRSACQWMRAITPSVIHG